VCDPVSTCVIEIICAWEANYDEHCERLKKEPHGEISIEEVVDNRYEISEECDTTNNE
jgi:hypothetical protein